MNSRQLGGARTRTEDPGTARRSGRVRRHEITVGYVFLIPAIIGLGGFFIYPLVTNIYYSFTNYNMMDAAQWVGLRNYKFMLHEDPQVLQAIGNTLWFTVIAIPLLIAFSVGLAVLVTSVKQMSSWYRTFFYLPTLLPPVAATLAMVFALNPGYGAIDKAIAFFGIDPPLWFEGATSSKWALIGLFLWGSGNTIVVMIAGVLDVPVELQEAASIDGANAWKRFWVVTVPTLRPVILFSVVTGIISGLQLFTQPYVANTVAGNGGAPILGYPDGSTLFYTVWIYQQGFKFFNVGYASALSAVLFVVTLVVTLILFRFSGSALGLDE